MQFFGLSDFQIIALISLCFSIVSTFVNHKFGNREKVKQMQKEVNDFQKKFQEAVKNKQEAEIKRLKEEEPKVMEKMQEMLWLPLKSMVIILPLFFIVISGVTSLFPLFTIQLPFGIHIHEITSLSLTAPSTYGARGWFIVVSIPCNLLLDWLYTKIRKMRTPLAKP